MIGAMPAVSVRHERRKKKTEMPIIKIGSRPNHLLLKPRKGEGGGGLTSPLHVSSLIDSRAGTPVPGDDDEMIHTTTYFRYGDECFYGKISLLHFIIFFLLGGLTVIIVGAVQFKQEAGLGYLRYHFLVVGGLLIVFGVFLLVIKCVWFRVPYPIVDFVTSSRNSPNHKGDGESLDQMLGRGYCSNASASPGGGSEKLHIVNRRKFSNGNSHSSPLEVAKRRESSDLREICRVASPKLRGISNGKSSAVKRSSLKGSVSSGHIKSVDCRQSPV